MRDGVGQYVACRVDKREANRAKQCNTQRFRTGVRRKIRYVSCWEEVGSKRARGKSVPNTSKHVEGINTVPFLTIASSPVCQRPVHPRRFAVYHYQAIFQYRRYKVK
jgi:hypothetical protein